MEYWNCNCGERYVHTKKVRFCMACGADRDKQPDSSQEDVKKYVIGITDKEYLELLKKHDWRFRFSDSGREYNQGSEERTKIDNYAEMDRELEKLRDEYISDHFGEKALCEIKRGLW